MIEENPYEDRFERTFAFVDLSGFTTFTDRWGDKAAVEVLNDFRFLVRTVASRKGIRIAKWLGDGAMLVAVEPETDRANYQVKITQNLTYNHLNMTQKTNLVGK